MNDSNKMFITALCAVLVVLAWLISPAAAQEKKPNILVIWGDDIGWYNISAYNMGVMGYRTPNIDRIAHEGALFTDWYGQQSCTRRVHHRAVTDPHRLDQGRTAGSRCGTPPSGSNDR